jgi:hypothetical protein
VYCPAPLAAQAKVFDAAVADGPIETLMLLKSPAAYPICHSRPTTWLPELESEMGSETLLPGDTEPAVDDNVALKSRVGPARMKLKTAMLSLSVFLCNFIRRKTRTALNFRNGLHGATAGQQSVTSLRNRLSNQANRQTRVGPGFGRTETPGASVEVVR